MGSDPELARRFLAEELEIFGGPLFRPFPSEPTPANELENYRRSIENCHKCPLGETRTRFVFGVGNPEADLMFVGEAPGRDEDLQGEPFVGRAGKLLDKILAAINLSRDEVYIANVLKCRPPGNRDPLPGEIEQCEPYLKHQIELIKPRLLVALGRVAARTLLRVEDSLKNMRRTQYRYHDIPMVVTYHPAALLRNPNLKRDAWEDFQRIKAFLDNGFEELQ